MKAARLAKPRRAALARAVASAAGLTSVPTPYPSGSSDNSASKIVPEPVPISAIRNRRIPSGRARNISNANSTTVSVSGRGTKVAAESCNGSPQNSLRPRMRATGSPWRRRSVNSSRRTASSDVRGRPAAAMIPVRSRPSTAPTSIRASSSAEPIEFVRNRAVSARRAVSRVCPAKESLTWRPRRSATTISPSSLRKQGPITTGPRCYRKWQPPSPNLRGHGVWVPAFAGTTWWCRSRRRALGGELGCLMLRRQRIDQFAKRFARDHLRELVECEVDAMIGDAALRKIIGADALGAVAGPDLLAAIRRARGIDALTFGVIDARAQDIHRGGAVLVLRTAVLHADHDTGRNVGDPDRGFGLVDVLAAGALRAHGLDLEIVALGLDVDFLDLRQHRHRRRRGVNAPLRFGVGHALHPVHAGFELQFGERAATLHFGDDFLEPAHGALTGGDHLDLPALQRSKALIHPEQVAGEQRGLVAAGAGADFQHDVAVVHGILGQQRHANLLRQLKD